MKHLLFSSLALLLLALLAHAPALAPVGWLAIFPALFFRLLPPGKWGALRLLWFSGALFLCGLSYGWLDGQTIRLTLLLALALKWTEAQKRAEFAFLAPASLLASAAGALHWGQWAALWLLALPLSLWVLESATRLKSGILPSLQRIARALPLAAVLFVFFPRIPGPLWDIGLTLGLPLPMGIERAQQGLGVSTRLKPGGQGAPRGVGENEPVLVAEFENWVPPTALLYWRGPVYYDFDGSQWQLDPEYAQGQGRLLMRKGWVKGADFAATFAKTGHEITYSVRLSAHEHLWLYGLDMPTALTSESFISADWQVLAHSPVTTETSYRMKSALDWESGGTLTNSLRQRALALPQTGNPRLRALGQELTALPPSDRPRAALAALSAGGYKVRERFSFQEGEDSLDTFWFEQREGNADLYAGTFVFLMRAANIPARLVTGYRGGKLMALTDYVIVKKDHAHAWVEIWDEAKGWQRIDPVDLIAPERFSRKASTQTEKRPQQKSPSGEAPVRQNTPPSSRAFFQLPELEDFLSRWVFRLDGQTQQEILSGLSGSGMKSTWLWLLAVTALGSAVVFVLGVFWTRYQNRERLARPERAWRRATGLLARHGFCPEVWECPSHFARRVAEARPLWAGAIYSLTHAYTGWRYAQEQTDPKQVESALRKLRNLILAQAPSSHKTP